MFVRKNYRIIWPEDHELGGLEVVFRPVSVGESLAFMQASSADSDATDADLRVQLRQMAEQVAEFLVSWNITDEGPDGEPVAVPATLDGVLTLDGRTLRAIAQEWNVAVLTPAAPLSRPSGSGERFPEGSIPMDALSESPSS